MNVESFGGDDNKENGLVVGQDILEHQAALRPCRAEPGSLAGVDEVAGRWFGREPGLRVAAPEDRAPQIAVLDLGGEELDLIAIGVWDRAAKQTLADVAREDFVPWVVEEGARERELLGGDLAFGVDRHLKGDERAEGPGARLERHQGPTLLCLALLLLQMEQGEEVAANGIGERVADGGGGGLGARGQLLRRDRADARLCGARARHGVLADGSLQIPAVLADAVGDRLLHLSGREPVLVEDLRLQLLRVGDAGPVRHLPLLSAEIFAREREMRDTGLPFDVPFLVERPHRLLYVIEEEVDLEDLPALRSGEDFAPLSVEDFPLDDQIGSLERSVAHVPGSAAAVQREQRFLERAGWNGRHPRLRRLGPAHCAGEQKQEWQDVERLIHGHHLSQGKAPFVASNAASASRRSGSHPRSRSYPRTTATRFRPLPSSSSRS